MIYLVTRLVAAFGGRSDWGDSRDAAKQRSYYRR